MQWAQLPQHTETYRNRGVLPASTRARLDCPAPVWDSCGGTSSCQLTRRCKLPTPISSGSESREKVNTILLSWLREVISQRIITVTKALTPSFVFWLNDLNWQSLFPSERRRFPETCTAFSWFYLMADKWDSHGQKVDVHRMGKTFSINLSIPYRCGASSSSLAALPSLSVNSSWHI